MTTENPQNPLLTNGITPTEQNSEKQNPTLNLVSDDSDISNLPEATQKYIRSLRDEAKTNRIKASDAKKAKDDADKLAADKAKEQGDFKILYEKSEEKARTLETEANTTKRENAILKLNSVYKLPEELLTLIQGTDLETIETNMKLLAKHTAKQEQNNNSNGGSKNGKNPPAAGNAVNDTEQLVQDLAKTGKYGF